jgi:crotonobetainyl-CoA:carnitine CoA-transferase CaiB-like acyl-CoA transferase
MGAAAGRHTRLTPPLTTGIASAYARHLLDSLAASFAVHSLRPVALADEHPALTWAESGLMALTGAPYGEPQMCPVPLAACADGALAALSSFAPEPVFGELRGSGLLAERAAIAGHQRAGRVSPGGSCRLLDTADGVIALNLAREDDWSVLSAWLETEVSANWEAVAAAVRARQSDGLVERGRLLGLAVALSATPVPVIQPWQITGDGIPRRLQDTSSRATKHPALKPLVIDLSSLWAGPLCSHLLQAMGADVVKVESLQRPDGARRGPPAFFDLLNAGKPSVALDFSSAQGREQLQALLRAADIVIEGSRPRALRQLGIQAEALVEEKPGLSWIALSGYGRGAAQEDWIAFGDDAAVAAGLSQLQYQASDQHLIVGDAIADPLTGLHAALVAWASHASGGGRLISLSLRDVVGHCIGFDLPESPAALRARQADWRRRAETSCCMPQIRVAPRPASELGGDTAAVLSGLGIAC